MAFFKFKDTTIGQSYDMTLLVTDIEQRVTQKGDPYCAITLSDGKESARANMFNSITIDALKEDGIETGSCVECEIRVSLYRENKNYTIDAIRKADLSDEDMSKLILMPPVSVKTLFYNILKNVKESSGRPYDINSPEVPQDDYSLTALTTRILWENRTAFMRSSAAKAMHHNLFGGLVYHTSRMTDAAVGLCQAYPDLNRELLVCGTALHDIGKITELNTSAIGTAEYSVDGRLLGHALIGIDMINKQVAEDGGKYDEEQIRLLKHMLASHHGVLEWGAIMEPAIKEAMVLHFIDMIDSRMYMYETGYETVETGELTNKIFGITGDTAASIYKSPYLN